MQNILFLTLSNVSNIDESGIYQDLLREFASKGHKVFVVSPTERRNQEKTHLVEKCNANILRVKTGNIQKTNLIEKGIATILLESQYISAIKTYLSDVKFDLILYSTPPITLAGAVQYIKKRDGAKTYLLLKDIFPQNAVDIRIMSKTCIKGLLYKYFRAKEKKLYNLSDKIGCMSQANVDYVIKHNPGIDTSKVHINPNSVEKTPSASLSIDEKNQIREKYNIPKDATTFIYGGNLGRPQGIPFLIECLRANAGKNDRYFVICGKGTDYPKLKAYVDEEKPSNVLLLNGLPKDEYEKFVKAFDVGLIFLDHRFTIPNFPSRLLSYMQSSMPVVACTDKNTDVGKVIVDGGFGWWCESNSTENFTRVVDSAIGENLQAMGENGFNYLNEHFLSEQSCDIILRHVDKEQELSYT